MSKTELNLVDFLYLQENIHDLERERKPGPKGNFVFPLLTHQTVREDEIFELGDILTASLQALNNSARKLQEQQISLGNDPIEIKLTGSLIGISTDADRILVRIKPENKR